MREYLIIRRGGWEWVNILSPLKRGRGRPRIHPDRKAYKAEKERERRAKKKANQP